MVLPFFRCSSRRAKRLGFTLIELLVVIAIVGILAALIFPVVARARQRGYQAGCASNLRQIAAAFTSYTADWDETFPPHLPPGVDPSIPEGDPWDRRLHNYVVDDRIYICPANPDGTFSYAYNAWIAQPERYFGPYRVQPTDYHARSLADLPEPSETILVFDVSNPDPNLRGMIGEHDVLGQTLEQMVDGSSPDDRDLVESWELGRLQSRGEVVPDWAWPRHFHGSEFGFVDGHVRWFLRLDRDYHLPPS